MALHLPLQPLKVVGVVIIARVHLISIKKLVRNLSFTDFSVTHESLLCGYRISYPAIEATAATCI